MLVGGVLGSGTFASDYGKEETQGEKIPEKAGRERFLGLGERIKLGNIGAEDKRMSMERTFICWNLLLQAIRIWLTHIERNLCGRLWGGFQHSKEDQLTRLSKRAEPRETGSGKDM